METTPTKATEADTPANMGSCPPSAASPWTKRRALRRLVIYSLLIASLVYLSGRFIIESFLFKTLAEEYLSARSGLLVTMGEISPSGVAGWGIRVGRLAVMDGSRPLLYAKGAVAELDMAAAMSGKARISSVVLSGGRLNLVRGSDGRLNVGAWESQGAAFEDMPGKIKRLLMSLDSIHMENCSISWTDHWVGKKSPVALRFQDINLRLGTGFFASQGRPLFIEGVEESAVGLGKFRVRGKITGAQEPGSVLGFTGNLLVSDLDTGHLWPYLGKILPFQKLDSKVSLDSLVIFGSDKSFTSKGVATVVGLDLLYRDAYRERLKAGRIALVHDVSIMGDSIAIRGVDMDAGALHLRVKGEAHKLLGDNPLLFVEMDLERTAISELKKYVPYKYLTEVQASFVEKYIQTGEIKLTGLTFDGDLATLERLDKIESYKSLSGMLEIFGLNFTVPGLKREFTNLGGEFILSDNKLFFNDLTGRYGASALRNITGVIGNLHEWPDFEAKIIAGLDLEETRQGLAAHLNSPEFKAVFDRLESMDGAINLDITAKGDSENLGKSLAVEGKMSLAGVGVKVAGFPLALHGMTGDVNLSLDKVSFPGMKWRIGDNQFKMTGGITGVLTEAPQLDLKIGSSLDLAETAKVLAVKVKDLDRLAGKAEAETAITGNIPGYRHQTRVDLTQADIIYLNTLLKRPAMPASMELAGEGKLGGQVGVDWIHVDMGRSSAEISGDPLGIMSGRKAVAHVKAQRVYLDDIDYYSDIFDNIESRGYLTLDITVESPGPDGSLMSTGKARMVDGTFKLNVFSAIFSECDGEFEMVNNQIFLTQAAGVFGKGKFTMTGSVEVNDTARFKLSAATKALDLEDLFGDPNPAVMERPGRAGVEGLWPVPAPGEKAALTFFDAPWEILLSSESGEIGPLKYQNLDTKVVYKADLFKVAPFTFEGHGGKWNWEADILDLRRSIDIKSKINVRDVALESLGDPAGEKLIYGSMNIQGEVNGHGRTWKQISSSLDGKLELNSGPGVIKRFNLLAKIFSLLNLSQYFKLKLPDMSVEGLPFDGVTAVFDLAAGVAYTNNLIVDSEAIKITAVGSHDISGNMVDMTIGAMPFVTIDRMISAVPVVGETLTGEDKSLIGYYFTARGPLENPEITSVSLEALAEGVAGIFRRVFRLAVRAGETLGGDGARGAGKK